MASMLWSVAVSHGHWLFLIRSVTSNVLIRKIKLDGIGFCVYYFPLNYKKIDNLSIGNVTQEH